MIARQPSHTSTSPPHDAKRRLQRHERLRQCREAERGEPGVECASAVAIPAPVDAPARHPRESARWMHSTPIAPTGAATAMPMTKVRANSASVSVTAAGGAAAGARRRVDSTTVVRVRDDAFDRP